MAGKPLIDGYIRVSQVRGREGDSFISPTVQHDQIQAWADLRGYRIDRWHEDLDQSGAKTDRPAFQEAIARIEAGETGGLAVAKLDRLARSLRNALDTLARVHDAGGVVISVAEGVDATTTTGKMMTQLLLLLAEWELDRIRETWAVARQRAVARGVHISSATPTGYIRREDGTLTPHPAYAPVIREVFERRAAGTGWTQLARLMDDRGVKGPYNSARWTNRAVATIVERRAYLGEAYSGEHRNPDAHEAIIDRGLWEAAQHAVPVPARRGPGEPALLAGLLRCAGCRHLMRPDKMTVRGGERVRIYRCRLNHSTGKCSRGASVMGRVVEPWIEAQVLSLLETQADATESTQELESALLALDEAEAELAAFRDEERILGALGREGYLAGIEARAHRVDAAAGGVAAARRSAGAVPGGKVLSAAWPDLTVTERQHVLRGAIDAVFVRAVARSNVPIGDPSRSLIMWAGQAPNDLPGRGKRVSFAPLDWPDVP